MQCPMNRVKVLEFNLDKVQNGESHFLIYARDIPRYIKACYEEIGIAPAQCQGCKFTFKRKMSPGFTTLFDFERKGNEWVVTSIRREYCRWNGNYRVQLSQKAREFMIAKREQF